MTLSKFECLSRYVRTIGRAGDGPGEYREPMMRLALGTDGTLLMYDASHMRVNRYGPTGASTTGFEPNNDWTVLPDGRLIAWRTDRLGFFTKGPRGMTVAELADAAHRFDTLERRELQALQDFSEKHRKPEGDMVYVHGVIPERTQAITELRLDLDQRVWLRRSTPSVRTPPRPGGPSRPNDPKPPTLSFSEPEVWIAFRLDGTYLGEVRFPLGVQVRAFDKDIAWGTLTSADDEPLLVKYSISGAQRGKLR